MCPSWLLFVHWTTVRPVDFGLYLQTVLGGVSAVSVISVISCYYNKLLSTEVAVFDSYHSKFLSVLDRDGWIGYPSHMVEDPELNEYIGHDGTHRD